RGTRPRNSIARVQNRFRTHGEGRPGAATHRPSGYATGALVYRYATDPARGKAADPFSTQPPWARVLPRNNMSFARRLPGQLAVFQGASDLRRFPAHDFISPTP